MFYQFKTTKTASVRGVNVILWSSILDVDAGYSPDIKHARSLEDDSDLISSSFYRVNGYEYETSSSMSRVIIRVGP